MVFLPGPAISDEPVARAARKHREICRPSLFVIPACFFWPLIADQSLTEPTLPDAPEQGGPEPTGKDLAECRWKVGGTAVEPQDVTRELRSPDRDH